MDPRVRRAIKDNDVARTVVRLVLILVMTDLVRSQRPAKEALRNKAVLSNPTKLARRIKHIDVSVVVHPPAS